MTSATKTESIPLYARIRESLRDDIEKKVLAPGQKIPSEDELAVRFGVSRMTARQGINDLIDEGLLYRRHGVGTFVAQRLLERDHSRLTSFMESARLQGIDVSITVLIADILPAKLHVSKALGLREGELVIHVKTLRRAGGIPITVHDAHIPYRLFPQLLQEDLEARPLWECIEGYGYHIKRAVQRLEAREADEEVAGLLEMDLGAPILFKERTVYSDDGAAVEFTYCYNRGDRYSLTVTLNR
jgi:GntR family transcriptional regulator